MAAYGRQILAKMHSRSLAGGSRPQAKPWADLVAFRPKLFYFADFSKNFTWLFDPESHAIAPAARGQLP